MPPFTLRQLEYLVAVADSGSIVGAAGRLRVSQPTVSDALAKLERLMGVGLFIRHHARGMSLTPAGRRLLPGARDLLRHAGEFGQSAEAAGEEVAGRLDIGCYVTLAPRYMPWLVTAFSEAHPEADFDLAEGFQGELVDGLLSGRFDLALLYDEDLPAGLDVELLTEIRPHVLLPDGHRLAGRRRIALSALAGEPFILFDVSPSREYFTGLLRAAGVEPRIAFASPSFEMVRGLVGQGRGYSLLVTRPCSDLTYDGRRVVDRPIAGAVRPGRICLARLAAARPTRLMEAFTAFSQQALARPAPRPAPHQDAANRSPA